MENQNVIVNPSAPKLPKKAGMPVFLQAFLGVLLALALVAVGAAAAYYLMQQAPAGNKPVSTNTNAAPGNCVPGSLDCVNTTTGELPPVPDTDEPDTGVIVAWNDPNLTGDLGLVAHSKETDDAGLTTTAYYYVGTVKGGNYSGGRVVLALLTFETMGSYNGAVRFIEKDGQYIAIKNNSEEYSIKMIKAGIKVDSDWTIPGLDLPKAINGPGAGQTLARVDFITPQFFKSNKLRQAFNYPPYGQVYTTIGFPDTFSDIYDRFGYYMKTPDGLVAIYQFKPSFFDDQLVPKITWNDGTINATPYQYTDTTGCGSANYVSAMSPLIVRDADLVQVGKNSANEPIYAFKDNNYDMLQKLYTDSKEYLKTQKILTYGDFIAIRPLVFWRDPFGRMIRFKSTKAMPLAECGKPVIYLYPEQTTDVSVKLQPQGGFSYTEPLYNGGWNVTAEPSGKLTNLADNKTYPYLFWEGRGGIYESPKKGFVVAQKEVHSFLVKKLAQLGLNVQETADFIEFWEPKMQGSPYYFVGFSGNAVMNQLAPLDITPKPDTTIRILMDFQPLQKPAQVQGYDIKTPERKGFTVVEWGGVLR